MKTKFIKTNIFIFIFFIFTILSLIGFFSYKFFLNSFIDLEKEQNKKNIISILSFMDKELNYIEDIIKDYAIWDDTYNFVKTKNSDYIYENFREGTNTLKDLELDFIIFTTIKNDKIYSNYENKDFILDIELFEKSILEKFQDVKNITTIYKEPSKIVKYNSQYFYIVKKHISNSDDTLPSNGYIYSGKIINNDIFNKKTKIFDEVLIKNKHYLENNFTINSDYLKNAQINIEEDDECKCLKNTIQLYDYDNNYIFSLITKSKRDLIKKGKEAILYYNISISLFLIFIFFLTYKNQKLLERYSDKLKIEVNNKTKELQESNEKFKMLSEQDELTKINNRRNFFKLGNDELNKSIKNNTELYLLMIDIDDFKKINDLYGHDAGDNVLIEVCKIINEELKNRHIFGRIGGEEFSIIFKDLDKDEVYNLTENIREKVEKSQIDYGNIKIDYTISIGVAKKDKLSSLDKILKKADELLYEAKRNGKNCVIRERV